MAKKKIFSSVSEADITRAIVGEFSKQFQEYVESDCLIVGAGPSGLMMGKEIAACLLQGSHIEHDRGLV